MLLAPVSDDEVKKAVFGLVAFWVPRPDGFPGFFFFKNFGIQLVQMRLKQLRDFLIQVSFFKN